MHQKLQKLPIKKIVIALSLIAVAIIIVLIFGRTNRSEDIIDTPDILEQPIFVPSNSENIDEIAKLFDDFSFETSKVNKVIHENNKYYSVNSVDIQGKGIVDNTNEVNITYKIGLDGSICDLAISLQTDGQDTTKLLDVLNKFLLADISDEVNSVVSSNATDKITKQLGSYGKIEFINKSITVEGLEFIKDTDHDTKVENYKAQLIESGTPEDEVNSINTDELFGSYKEYSKSKNLMILGITLNTDSVSEIDRMQFTARYNNCIMNSGTSNIISNDTYSKFIESIGAQEISINNIEMTNNYSIVIDSTIHYTDYDVPCSININGYNTTVEYNTNKFSSYDEFIENLSNILKSLYNIDEQIEIKSLPDDSEKYFESEDCNISVNIKYSSDDTYEASIKSIEYYKEV